MNLTEIIRTLYIEKAKVEDSIAALEALESPNQLDGVRLRGRRGRKTMGEDERRQVSERMKKYWASRRQVAEVASQVGSN